MSDDTETDDTQVAEPAFQKTAEEMSRQEIRRALLQDYIANREKHPLPIRRVLRDLFEDWEPF